VVTLAGVALACSDSPAGRPDGGAAGAAAAGASGTAGGAAMAGAAGSAVAGAAGSAAGSDGGAAGAGGGAAGGAAGAAGAAPLAAPTPIGLAALNADSAFDATSLSILDPAGGLAKADCVDSKVPTTGGSTPVLSTDVVFPSQPQRGGNVVIVDRGNGALTFVNPSTCAVVRQVAVPNATSLRADMDDVVIASDSKAYVTRYGVDATTTDPSKVGNDVITIDPATGTFKSRISLDAYASVVTGATILARPDRALIASGQIAISLGEIDTSFYVYGEGKVVLIDPTTDTVTASVAVTGLYDCSGLDYLAASKTLLVSCGGPYGDPDRLTKSGIGVIDLSVSPPALARTITSAAFGTLPINFSWVLSAPTAASPTRAFASTSDPDFNGGKPDILYAFDFAAGTATQIATSDQFAIGPSAATASLLFVPEALAAAPKIQLFDITATPQPTIGFASDTVNMLSPTAVAWY
jgi:hypothetical protein